jgi:thiol-disulfide isomerase/thioredoxin
LAREIGRIRETERPMGFAERASLPVENFLNGSSVPTVEVRSLGGATLSFPPDPTSYLIFGMAHCGPCEKLLRQIGPSQEIHGRPFTIVMYSNPQEVSAIADGYGLLRDLIVPDPDRSLCSRYGVNSFPFAISIRDATIRAQGIVNSIREIELLDERTLGEVVPAGAPVHQIQTRGGAN